MTLLTILSVALLLLDERSMFFQHFQTRSSILVVPLQYIVNWPVRMTDDMINNMATQQQILEENASLRAKELLLQAKLQRVAALENENAQLRALLQSSPHVGGKYSMAQLLAVNMEPSVQKVVLDKGTRDNVYVGQPVLDATGVMGQVVQVGLMTSQVLLVTDPQSAISVQDSRNGIRAIAAGTGDFNLQLLNVPDSTDVQEGDLMITSGLDQRFPQGYPVGVVKKVTRDPEYRFATIALEPSAKVNQSRMVLLVWPDSSAFTKIEPADPNKNSDPNQESQ